MTHRSYGKWPGWMVEAGWNESTSVWYVIVSKFDGKEEIIWDGEDYGPPINTVEGIDSWLNFLAEKVSPELKPPANFTRDLRNDKGKTGCHKTVQY